MSACPLKKPHIEFLKDPTQNLRFWFRANRTEMFFLGALMPSHRLTPNTEILEVKCATSNLNGDRIESGWEVRCRRWLPNTAGRRVSPTGEVNMGIVSGTHRRIAVMDQPDQILADIKQSISCVHSNQSIVDRDHQSGH